MKALSKMTPAEKRVQVAKDVIKQVEAKKLKPARGTYVQFARADRKLIDAAEGKSLQPFLKNLTKPCEVCAIGSALIAYVDRFNRVAVPSVTEEDKFYRETSSGKLNDRHFAESALRGVFDRETLRAMELDFEETTMLLPKPLTAPKALVAIMQRVIDGQGKYEPMAEPETEDAAEVDAAFA